MSDDPALEVFSSSLIKTVCDRSLSPNAELGQNFLIDWEIPRREVNYADIDRDDTVLEIGPGLGSLTVYLAEASGKTFAIEKDERLKPLLANIEDSYENLEVVYGDALDIDLGEFDFDTVVANLPFAVSLPIIFELLEEDFDTAVLLIQKNLADRITKSPGESGYNRLSVQLSRTANLELISDVEPSSFYPAPDVDGSIVRIERVEPKFEIPTGEFFKDVLMFLFSQREKTVHQALLELVSIDSSVDVSVTDLTELQETVGEVADTEIERVSPHGFGEITNYLWEQYGNDLMEVFESYYDEHDLYKRARGKNSD